MPWRPVEPGTVERVHQITQQVMGMLVLEVLKANPADWSEMFPVIEFVVYNTPGPHGYTPRDLDRRWSLATPLEKELQPFQVMDFEPVTDWAKEVFKKYREIRERVIQWYAQTSEKRAELANRFRRSRTLLPGMKVVYRDPRARAAGGRTPWRKPQTEPFEVVSVSGNKCVLRRPDGTLVPDAHVEDTIIVPDSAKDLEREPIEFAPDDPQTGDHIDQRKSPGEMLEQAARGQAAEGSAPTPGAAKRAKLDKVGVGGYVAYAAAGKKKTCRIGRVQLISKAEQEVVVHRHRPLTDGRLRVRWKPTYWDESQTEVIEEGSKPSLERVAADRLVTLVPVSYTHLRAHETDS